MRRALCANRWQALTPLASDVDVSATNDIVSSLKLGFTHVQAETNNATTKAILATAAYLENQHLLGFGSTVDPQARIVNKALSAFTATLTTSGPIAGWAVGQSVTVSGVNATFNGTYTLTAKASTSFSYAKPGTANVASSAVTGNTAVATNFTGLDAKFGYPTRVTGIMPNADEIVITLCGSPCWMRLATNSDIDPYGNVVAGSANATGTSAYPFVHSSNFQASADLVGLIAARYPHITHFQGWNEMKGMYINTPVAGSALVRAGWTVPAGPAGGGRYWYEGYTQWYNLVWAAVKAQVTADSIPRAVSGPYPVFNTYAWEFPADWADDAFPNLLMGSWGYADKGTLALLKYFIRYCTGTDFINVDIRNNTKDWEADDYVSFAADGVTPVANAGAKWGAYSGAVGSGPPHGGSIGRYWLAGDTLGPWGGFEKMAAFKQWLVDLGAYDGDGAGVYRRAAADAGTLKVWYSEWYGHPFQSQRQVNPMTAAFYPALPATLPEKTAVMAWGLVRATALGVAGLLIWKPEGDATSTAIKNPDGDSFWSNPLALYGGRIDAGATNAGVVTGLKAVCDAVVAQFGAGKQLKVVTVNNSLVTAMATSTHILIVSRSSSYLPLVVAGVAVVLDPFEVRLIVR